ncbi:MAG: bifunctional demethylmenaquinone methyltransferase/2-methoxy-6-polyprenyl-1,4-benzoquinol methylase UbiE [Bacteroidota bacterium]
MIPSLELVASNVVNRQSPHRTIYEQSYVRSMFDSIAGRYDLLNHLLSAGLDIVWRRKTIELILPFGPKNILDVATGTGDLALAAMRLNPESITGIDLSPEMLHIAQDKIDARDFTTLISLEEGSAERLRFAPDSFDAVTVGFGVRNFSDLHLGLAEILRVLRPGGVAAMLEFSQPTATPLRQIYRFYAGKILPVLGGVISGNSEAYSYLPKTVSEFPFGTDFLAVLDSVGFTRTSHHPLSAGIVAIYLGVKGQEGRNRQ